MRVSDFHFDLPEELIAQHPPAERGASRMLVMRRGVGDAALRDAMFADLPDLLRADDLLVLNDSRVMPARLFGRRVGAGVAPPSGVVEVLLVEEMEAADAGGLVWRVLVKPGRKVRVGDGLEFFAARSEAGWEGDAGPVLTAEVVECGGVWRADAAVCAGRGFSTGCWGGWGICRCRRTSGASRRAGQTRRKTGGGSGAVSDGVCEAGGGRRRRLRRGCTLRRRFWRRWRRAGWRSRTVTLHVGLGTFQPVRVSELKDIRLHSERYTLPAATAEALNRALAEGRRVVAVGTTTTRTCWSILRRRRKKRRRGRARWRRGASYLRLILGRRRSLLGRGIGFGWFRWAADELPSAGVDAADAGEAFAGAGDEGRRSGAGGVRSCGAGGVPVLFVWGLHAIGVIVAHDRPHA
jgi:S-adenosylmethionine:tRNA ribosyltransferase-isomerase